jgi:hypothetical protein
MKNSKNRYLITRLLFFGIMFASLAGVIILNKPITAIVAALTYLFIMSGFCLIVASEKNEKII